MRTALYPGSFDPLHNGHVDTVEIASRLFDRVVIAAMRNSSKADPMFSLEERKEMLVESLGPLGNVDVVSMTKLTVDVAREVGADVILKGLRFASDFEYELQQAQTNKSISGIETLFIPCATTSGFIASSLVRQIAQFGGADRVDAMVPGPVARRLKERFQK